MNMVSVFAGDLGGYMGLLLGGSVISIIEFIDLIVYNSLVKCSAKNRKSTKKDTGAQSGATNHNVPNGIPTMEPTKYSDESTYF